mgnify:FL=1
MKVGEFLKFIFPQNYKFSTKIFGLIDYQTAILNCIWGGGIFLIINTLFKNINIKIFLFISFVFPILIFSIVGINGEKIIDVIIYMSKFIIKPKLLFYDKSSK